PPVGLPAPPGQGVDRCRQQQDQPGDDELGRGGHPEQVHAVLDRDDHEATEQRRVGRPAPAEQAGAPAHGPGRGVEVGVVCAAPEDWLTANSREAPRTPPAAASVEASVNTTRRTLSTLIPARRALAGGAPPPAARRAR